MEGQEIAVPGVVSVLELDCWGWSLKPRVSWFSCVKAELCWVGVQLGSELHGRRPAQS